MRWLCRCLAGLGVVALVMAIPTPPVGAAETASSDVVIIREDVVVHDDLYATGLRVVIQGEIDGDLVALAAEEVVIEGMVTGDVIAVTRDVTVSGSVGGSLRVTAASLSLTGSVGDDVVAAAVAVDFTDGADVSGDTLLWAYRAGLGGSIGGDLEGTIKSLDVAGSVGGNVDVTVSDLEVTAQLQVAGDLAYRSDREATGLDHADVGGVVVQKTPLPPNVRVRALGLLTRMLAALALTAASILVAMGWPATVQRGSQRIVARPIRSFVIGLLVVASPLVVAAAGVVLVSRAPGEVSLPLLAIVVPLAIAMTGVVLVFSLVAGAPAVLLLGRLVRRSLGVYGGIFLGGVIAGVVWLLPVVGYVVPLLVLPLGMGGWLMALRSRPDTGAITEPDG